MTELALVFPLFIMVFFGIIILGLVVFYDQQVANAAREAARYATVHSATSRCPTVSTRDPDAGLLPLPNNYYRCDAPEARWPFMTAQARSRLFGLATSGFRITACWSGHWTKDNFGNWADYDQVAVTGGTANPYRQCTVRVWGWTPAQNPEAVASSVHVIDPTTGQDTSSGERIRLDCSKDFPLTTTADDMASNFSASNSDTANRVTVIGCYAWQPPLAGFLLIPGTVTLQSSVTEGLEYQQ